MKTPILLFFFLISLLTYSQKSLSLDDDFKLDPALLKELAIAKIPENMSSIGLTHNPGVFCNKNTINYITRLSSDEIECVYLEIYQSDLDDSDDAGVIVMHFNSKDTLDDALPTLPAQSNIAYLTKDNFVIQVWSDVSSGSQEQIDNMVNYYKNKLQANFYEAEDHALVEEVLIED